ncbi:MAG TPA: right-handed parallel beta-helix repeat-containing protein, partial [Bacteroidia bacterium]|nr:right-handed parallel beta-helix repeat-containing protein [Bacteroidia bacterium]
MKYTLFLLAYASLFFVLKEDKNAPPVYVLVRPGSEQVTTSHMHPVVKIPAPSKGRELQQALQAALDTAHDGDEIRLPEGAYPITKTICISHYVSIRGAGSGKTLLCRPEGLSDDLLSSDTLCCLFRFCTTTNWLPGLIVSDIGFQSKRPMRQSGDGGSLAADIGIQFTHCQNFTVTRCRFEYFGNAAISVIHSDSVARGLINKNSFYHNVKGPDGLGLGYGVVVFGENKKWMDEVHWGSDNFIFVEDNIFEGQRHAIAAGGCGMYVFRYNSVYNNILGAYSAQAVDAHEARCIPGLNYYSTRGVEIYHNKLINTAFKNGSPLLPGSSAKNLVENAILIRGGEALIFENQMEGYRFGVGLINFEANDSLSCGSAKRNTSVTLFIWDNHFSPYPGKDTSTFF